MVRTGEGVLDSIWHTHGMIENFTPSALPAMRLARQQRGELGFHGHQPAACAGRSSLRWCCCSQRSVLALRHPRFSDLAPLAATAALAIVANAAVCGVLANPHDRYGARMVWLATLVVILSAAVAGKPPRLTRAGQGG